MLGVNRSSIAAMVPSLLCGLLILLLALPAAAQSTRPNAQLAAPAAKTTTRASLPVPFSCPFCDLSNAQLAKRNLTNANLQGANLTNADLSGANLSGAILARANLTNANLSGANLGRSARGRADLSAANLTGINLKGASLDGTNLQYTDLSTFENTGVDLNKAIIVKASMGDTVTCGSANLSNLKTKIFVSPTGTDSPTCGTTLANACATISTGISRCSGDDCGVLAMYGQYTPTSTIALADGINVYGGCLAGQAANSAIQSLVTAPANGQPAMSAGGIVAKGVILQGFRLQGTTGGPNGSASTALLLNNSKALQVIDSQILAGAGGPGKDGQTGDNGTDGAPASGATAGKTAQCSNSAGGNGSVIQGVSVDVGVFKYTCKPSCSANTCYGYWAAMGAAGGKWGNSNCAECPSSRGDTGNPGTNGSDAGCGTKGIVSNNTAGTFSGTTWQASIGGSGGDGGTGSGGGGGGAGGYKAGACFWVKTEDPGNQGGGGGAGGCGGVGGYCGQQGGASFAVTMFNSQIALVNSTIVGGRGGTGGVGGAGGSGGKRGDGADGLTNNGGGYGGRGGTGGAGGAAGGGAGGNGGPGIGIALVSNSSVADTGTIYYHGASGTPGGFGSGGQPVVSGLCPGPNGDTGVSGTVTNKRDY